MLLEERRRLIREEKRSYITVLKRGPCMDCRGTYRKEAMTFDHRPGEIKAWPIYQLVSHPYIRMPTLLRELDKCDLVCVGCHRDRTNSRLPPYVMSCWLHRPHRESGCKKCNHAVAIANMKVRRLSYIRQIKDRPCMDCGLKHDPWKMDFDHLGGKVDNISNLIGSQAAWSKILEELPKCEVVCCWCHVDRTVLRENNGKN